MIFVTVGTDQPFDRMIKIVDSWALTTGRKDIFAQIGKGGWRPRSIQHSYFLSPLDFNAIFNEAAVIVSHAGMGTILLAMHHGKPMIVMPKLATLGEHRNEHQLATARRMQDMGYTNVAFNEAEMNNLLERVDSLVPHTPIPRFASGQIISAINNFITAV